MNMRKMTGALLGLLMLVGAGAASATQMTFDGRAVLQFSNLGRIRVIATGTGVATLNGSGTSPHLQTLDIVANTGQLDGIIPVTDPIVTAGGIVEVRLTSVMQIPQVQGGIFAPISGALQNTAAQLTLNTVPSVGFVRLCLFYTGCNSGDISQDLNQTNGTGMQTGAGVGGVITIGGSGNIRISILGAPWTIKTASVSNRTDNAGLTLFTQMGFAHGPASLTSSTAQASGVVQLVTANQTTVVGVPGNSDLSGQVAIVRLHFVPEPGLLLLLGSGALGMALLGRQRMKNK